MQVFLIRIDMVTLQAVYLFKADVSFFHQVGKVGYCCVQELAEVELSVKFWVSILRKSISWLTSESRY